MQHPTSTGNNWRARVLLAEYDMASPEANTRVVGITARSKEEAEQAIAAVCKGSVIDCWRQDMAPTAPDRESHRKVELAPDLLQELLDSGRVTRGMPLTRECPGCGGYGRVERGHPNGLGYWHTCEDCDGMGKVPA